MEAKPKKLNVKKGDQVLVLSGDNKGVKAEVLKVFPKEGKAIVHGVNVKTKHRKPSATNQEGGIIKEEAPVWVSKLMVIDTKGDATRIGRKKNSEGKLKRFSKRNGEFLD